VKSAILIQENKRIPFALLLTKSLPFPWRGHANRTEDHGAHAFVPGLTKAEKTKPAASGVALKSEDGQVRVPLSSRRSRPAKLEERSGKAGIQVNPFADREE
jgi:hypothetical protein